MKSFIEEFKKQYEREVKEFLAAKADADSLLKLRSFRGTEGWAHDYPETWEKLLIEVRKRLSKAEDKIKNRVFGHLVSSILDSLGGNQDAH